MVSETSASTKTNFSNVARHLTEAITSGNFAVGTLLPTELQLCAQYSTSRHTVRMALAELQQLGLVSRRKNVGTRVVSAVPKAMFRPTLASVDDLVQFGVEYLRVVQSIGKINAASSLAKDIGCASGTVWLRVSSLRTTRESSDARVDAPIGWTDVYFDPAYSDVGALVQASPDTLISALIEARYGRQIAEIQQDVRAFTIDDAAMAKALKVATGTSALKIVRRYFDAQGDLFEASVSIHPAERFSVSMRLQRSPA